MSDPLIITAADSILSKLDFKPYRSKVERRVIPFLPKADEPQVLELDTPWGEKLNASKGDFLVSEIDSPEEFWPVDPRIFSETYVITRPGYAVKKAVTFLVPLVDTTGDPDLEVIIISLEGMQKIRAGDFYLARGILGEIWPIPKVTIDEVMVPAELADELIQHSHEKSEHPSGSSQNLVITSTDSILSKLDFKPYRSKVERRVIPFLPKADEPQTMKVYTPWGTSMTARYGDFLVSEIDSPDEFWPVDPAIFEESYVITRPGQALKKEVTLLAPMTDITNDPDLEVIVVNLKDPATVRAGDFYLARGIKGEIWPIPKETVEATMIPADQAGEQLRSNNPTE